MSARYDINGMDIQRYNYMIQKAEVMGFKVEVKYEGFELTKGQKYYGKFGTVENLLFFLNGFEVGKSEGKCEAISEYQIGHMEISKKPPTTSAPTSTE